MAAPSGFEARVLRALIASRARFVVIGGVAVNLQGVPRFTADLDIAIALEDATLRAVSQALTGLGLTPRIPVPASRLEDRAAVQDWIDNRNMIAFTFQDVRDPLRQVDVVLAPGVPFDEIEAAAESLRAFGLDIPVADIDTLIRMKSATGRPQDASDVDALRRVLELRRLDE